MKQACKLLIVRDGFDHHLQRLINNLKQINPEIVIDYFTINNGEEIPQIIKRHVRSVIYYCDSKSIENKGLISRHLSRIRAIRSKLKELSKKIHYDVINIHYPYWEQAIALKSFRRLGNRILLSPWGSDVYRISAWQRKILKRLYDGADNISGIPNRFMNDVCRYFSIPNSKVVNLNIGSDVVDYISENKELLSVADAKSIFKIPAETYTITCGYNASKAQQHVAILEQLIKIKDKLSSDFMVLLPMTYASGNSGSSYRQELISLMESNGIKYKIFTEYLDSRGMFDLMRASDMFIHVQTTDADSGSVKEFILSGANTLNGAWLKYDDLDNYDVKPYYAVRSLDELGDCILTAISKGCPKLSDSVVNAIEAFGWKQSIVSWNNYYLSCCE